MRTHEFYWNKYRNSRAQRYSGISKFRQNGTYEKKTKDNNKTEWRKRKGFAKDQGRQAAWCGCGPYLKDVDHRSRRAYEREMIDSGRWDEMINHREYHVSSWDAC
jgi:hypothetical protein